MLALQDKLWSRYISGNRLAAEHNARLAGLSLPTGDTPAPRLRIAHAPGYRGPRLPAPVLPGFIMPVNLPLPPRAGPYFPIVRHEYGCSREEHTLFPIYSR